MAQGDYVTTGWANYKALLHHWIKNVVELVILIESTSFFL